MLSYKTITIANRGHLIYIIKDKGKKQILNYIHQVDPQSRTIAIPGGKKAFLVYETSTYINVYMLQIRRPMHSYILVDLMAGIIS